MPQIPLPPLPGPEQGPVEEQGRTCEKRGQKHLSPPLPQRGESAGGFSLPDTVLLCGKPGTLPPDSAFPSRSMRKKAQQLRKTRPLRGRKSCLQGRAETHRFLLSMPRAEPPALRVSPSL